MRWRLYGDGRCHDGKRHCDVTICGDRFGMSLPSLYRFRLNFMLAAKLSTSKNLRADSRHGILPLRALNNTHASIQIILYGFAQSSWTFLCSVRWAHFWFCHEGFYETSSQQNSKTKTLLGVIGPMSNEVWAYLFQVWAWTENLAVKLGQRNALFVYFHHDKERFFSSPCFVSCGFEMKGFDAANCDSK